ncbi:MAG: hypothetical protein HY698_10695 [Deltaproteobacteria bacterium]|nr:hypothetical protein [Deltaproteobacteria bacterium]
MKKCPTFLIALGILWLIPRPASAQVKTAACGLRNLPLAAGNTWTYRSGSVDVTIRVLEVTAGKDAAGRPVTKISVEEKLHGRTHTTSMSCTTQGLSVPPDSFFFAGEPGGAVGGKFTETAREGVTWPQDAALAPGISWVEKVKADQSGPHLAAHVEVERHVAVKGPEQVVSPLGRFTAQRVGFELRGRGVVKDQKQELPVKRPGTFWIARGVGVLRVEDAFDRAWELVGTNLVPGR